MVDPDQTLQNVASDQGLITVLYAWKYWYCFFSGPTYFMVLSREGAVDGWRSLIGETDPSKAKEIDPES